MTDRSRDTSDALTEVRTVLSRAEAAMVRLLWCSYGGNIKRSVYLPVRHDEPPVVRWHYDHEDEPSGATPDPDTEDMYEALQQVVRLLERWRRAGKKRR